MLSMFCRLVTLCSMGLFFCNCSDPAIPVEKQPGVIAVGESETVILDGNPSTGYNWYCLNSDELKGKVEVNISVVNKNEGEQKNSPLCGAPVQITVKCTGLSAGEALVKLGYFRPWEKTPPLKTKDIPIKVLP